MGNLNLTVEHIKQLKNYDVVDDDGVKAQFIKIYNEQWKKEPKDEDGRAVYERERLAFKLILQENQDLRDRCTPHSVFFSFIDLAASGLSVKPGAQPQAYLIARNVKVGKKPNGDDDYQKQCRLVVTGYGELVNRMRCGQITSVDNPIVVYQEDSFSFYIKDSRKCVDYRCNMPHTSKKIVAAFMKINLPGGHSDYAVMLPEDWERLAVCSARQNKKWDNNTRQYIERPNALYTSNDGQIDKGFLIAKLVKHAFKTYPKAAHVSGRTELESQQIDEQPIGDDIYGVDTATGEIGKDETVEAPFGQPADTSAGVVVDPSPTADGNMSDDEPF